MTLSIRARLTLWYSTVVVLVLATGAVVGSLAQSRLALRHLDDGLARAMATLEGVMRTEFREGLTLEAAAEEASVEVVAPDRMLALTRDDGGVLAVWGVAIDPARILSVPMTSDFSTVQTAAGVARVLGRPVDAGGHRYRAFVAAPLDMLREQHRENVRALVVGVMIALLTAAAGGWLIGRQTLRPLTQMSEQAARIDHRTASERLAAANPNDELGQLARSFNELLDRLSDVLRQQRQFMADASHELRTPVSVVRTATEVTLAKDTRPAEEYREALTIVAEQVTRLSRLVEAMFLLSRAEAQGLPLRREFLNLDDLVAESARALRVLAVPRNVTIATEGDQEVGFTGDDGLLRQMIGNLLDNAIRHARPGGVVMVGLRQAAGQLIMRVTDDGTGDLETVVVGKTTGPEVRAQALFRDRFIGVVRAGHVLSKGKVTPVRYAAARHICVSRRVAGTGPIDDAFVVLGLERQIATIVGGFSAALALARGSDLVASVPERHTAGLRAGMEAFPLPLPVPEFTVSLLWHPRMDGDPAHRWLRGCVRDACTERRVKTAAK